MHLCVYVGLCVYACACMHTCTLSTCLYVPPACRSLRPEEVLNPLGLGLLRVPVSVLELTWKDSELLNPEYLPSSSVHLIPGLSLQNGGLLGSSLPRLYWKEERFHDAAGVG